jgi:hypothetical protein
MPPLISCQPISAKQCRATMPPRAIIARDYTDRLVIGTALLLILSKAFSLLIFCRYFNSAGLLLVLAALLLYRSIIYAQISATLTLLLK